MTRPILIGLTGSIGMGKTTTAAMFAEEGVPVWDADAVVDELYSKGGAAVDLIRALRPEAVVDGMVDRGELKAWIVNDRDALRQIESVVHPLVGANRVAFLEGLETEMAVLDIPLLFESGGDSEVDVVVVVSVPPEVQRERVLERRNMGPSTFETILKKQMPDAEKRARADFVIETDTLEHARAQVRDVIENVRKARVHA